jgi:hypothetical protein
MRTLTAQEILLLGLPDGYQVRARTRVKDGGGTFQDLSSLNGFDWLTTARWGQNIDDQVASATITLIRAHYGFSLAPLMTASPLNRVSGSYSPLLQVGREVKLDIAILPRDGSGAVTWNTVFHGYIHDVDSASDPIELQCLDLGHRLQWRQIKTPRTYSNPTGVAVETVMQSILDDNIAPAGTVSLYTPPPGPPGWNIKEFSQDKKSVIEALTFLARQIGWDVRYLWDNGTSSFRLTFYEPDRAKVTPDYTLKPSMYLDVTELRTSLSDIRNDIDVTFTNRAVTDPNGDYARQTVNSQDATSIAKYDDQWAEAAEASASNIDTSTEALKMATAMCSDLKEPVATHTIEAHLLPQLELGDLILCKANGVHYDVDQALAITSVQHQVSVDKARTTVAVRGKPSGPRAVWLEIAAAPGVAPSVKLAAPAAPTGLTATAIAGGLAVKFAPPPIGNWEEFELHLSAISGFTPSAATFKQRGSADRFEVSDLVPGTTQYAKVVAVDANRNRSAASSQVSLAAGYTTPLLMQPLVTFASIVPNPDFEANNTAAAPPDTWAMATPADWAVKAFLETSTVYTGGNSIKFTAAATLLSQFFVIRGGDDFSLKWSRRSTSASGSVTLNIDWCDASFATISTFSHAYSFVAANTWVYDQIPYPLPTAPSTAKYARVRIVAAPAAANSVFVDSINLFPIQNAIVYADASRQSALASNIANATWTLMEWNLSNLDTHSAISTLPWKWTCPAGGSGWYQINAAVTLTGLTAGTGELIMEIYVNGTSRWRGTRVGINTSVQTAQVAATLLLTAADYVQIFLWQSNGAGRNIETAVSEANHFSIIRLGRSWP